MSILDTVKELFEKFLKLGTPPEKEVRYEEVIKREVPKESAEALFMNDVKQSFKEILSSEETDTASSSEIEETTPVTKAVKKNTPAEKTPVEKTPNKQTSSKTTEETKTSAKKPVTKKPVTKKPEIKKTTSKKTTSKKPGTKKAEKIALYIKDIKKHYGEVDEDFVAIVVKNLGPSIYRKDAELVSCSDPKELDTVRRNFLIKKLGLDESKEVLDAAIQEVCTELKGVRKKYRATFYYALAKKFNKASVLS